MAVETGGSNANVQVVLEVGATEHALSYAGTTDKALSFGPYTVVAADGDDDGIRVVADGSGRLVRVSGGASVKGDAASGGNAANLAHASVTVTNGVPPAVVDAVRVRGTNAAPGGSDFTRGTEVDTDLSFAAADFAIADSDGDPLAEVRVETLPAGTAGVLKLDGTAIASGDLPEDGGGVGAGQPGVRPGVGVHGRDDVHVQGGGPVRSGVVVGEHRDGDGDAERERGGGVVERGHATKPTPSGTRFRSRRRSART